LTGTTGKTRRHTKIVSETSKTDAFEIPTTLGQYTKQPRFADKVIGGGIDLLRIAYSTVSEALSENNKLKC